MTDNDIIRMAQEAGPLTQGPFDAWCKRFANLVAAHKTKVALAEAYRCGYEAGAVAEREACRFCFSEKGCWTWRCYTCDEIDDVQKPAPPQQYDEDEVLAETARYRAEVERLNAKLAEPMTEVADRFAHRMALELECVLSDGAYSNKWYKSAMQVLSEYRSAMNEIQKQHSPTFMGEPKV